MKHQVLQLLNVYTELINCFSPASASYPMIFLRFSPNFIKMIPKHFAELISYFVLI